MSLVGLEKIVDAYIMKFCFARQYFVNEDDTVATKVNPITKFVVNYMFIMFERSKNGRIQKGFSKK